MTRNQPTIEIVDSGPPGWKVACERTRTPYIWWDEDGAIDQYNEPGWVLRTFTDDSAEDTPLEAADPDYPSSAIFQARSIRPDLRRNPDDIRADVIEAGKQRTEIEEQRDDIMHRLNFLVIEARDAGIGPSELSRLSGLSRRAIYDWTF